MTAPYKEKDFEDAIEAHLLAHGWLKGTAADFDRELALDPKHLFTFVEDTQPDLWGELRKNHKDGLEQTLTDTLVRTLESRGTLDVIRHGLKFYGKKIDVAYFRPAHGLNPDILDRYGKNRLVVTRQVKFIPDRDDSVDLMLGLNGLPVATVELKNPMTNQNVGHAIGQYERRDPRHTLFQFKKRTLVHFAVDPDLVFMTTRLEGDSTYFLPFNRGADGGRVGFSIGGCKMMRPA